MLRSIKNTVCKRCGGHLFWDRDSEGVSVSCIQCGAVHATKLLLEVKKVKRNSVKKTGDRVASR